MNGGLHIIAVGNSFYGDDGVGAAVLARLRRGDVLPGAVLTDIGTDALKLLDVMDPRGRNVVIDAARMGLEPGAVAAFRPDEVRLRVKSDHLSLHGFGLAEAFGLARKLGRMPERVVVVGVEPQRVAIDLGLSNAVAEAVPRVISLIQEEVQGDDGQDHPAH